MDKAYRRAVRILSRPSARVLAANAEAAERLKSAKAEVRTLLDAGGDVRSLYQNETDRDRRVVLLGVLRREMTALD